MKDRLARRRRREAAEYSEKRLMIYEIFGKNNNAARTYMDVLGWGRGMSFNEIAEHKLLSVRTIGKHLAIAVEVGVAVKEENGSITLKEPTMEFLKGLIDKQDCMMEA
jgi:hypothetical protein